MYFAVKALRLDILMKAFESEGSIPQTPTRFSSWLSSTVLANLESINGSHFFLFVKTDDQANISVCGHKVFASFEEYMHYGANLPGNVQICGFPGNEAGKVGFGIKTTQTISKFSITTNVPDPRVVLDEYVDRTKKVPFNEAEFFKAIEDHFSGSNVKLPLAS
jgi:hypothetical protein